MLVFSVYTHEQREDIHQTELISNVHQIEYRNNGHQTYIKHHLRTNRDEQYLSTGLLKTFNGTITDFACGNMVQKLCDKREANLRPLLTR